ncbi:MAG: hypothetical protein IJN54_17430 [Lachnospiraceae bacterium]|nr:hypothetical protein [Lachnospiraceae bacterium]
MSYCVNCGVELETSLSGCPLCNTPVINPNELSSMKKTSPYPMEKGQVEVVNRKDWAILLSVVCGATAFTCGLLNFLVFNGSLWSLLVIGVCIIIWVATIPVTICPKLPVYVSLLADGMAIGVYLYMITFVTRSDHWFFALALPIIALLVCIAEVFTLLERKVAHTFLSTALYLFGSISIICAGIEILIDNFLKNPISLSWSAIVLTVCAIIEITLITILSHRRFRNALRRRLHF